MGTLESVRTVTLLMIALAMLVVIDIGIVAWIRDWSLDSSWRPAIEE